MHDVSLKENDIMAWYKNDVIKYKNEIIIRTLVLIYMLIMKIVTSQLNKGAIDMSVHRIKQLNYFD